MDRIKGVMDWDQVRDIDVKYYLHPEKTLSEYIHLPIAKTEGSYLITPEGERYLDFMSQLLCVNLGQSHPKVQAEIKKAADRYGFVWDFFCTDYRSKATKLIMEDILGDDGWAGRLRFFNTGSEANEAAMIIARLYTGRPNILTREYAYHGWTTGAAAATRVRAYRSNLSRSDRNEIRDVPGATNPTGFLLAPPPYCYRCPIGHTYPECKDAEGTLACVKATEHILRTVGPETVAAFIAEPVMGAGTVHPPAEYIPQMRKLTRDLDILWIDDEVLCGFGRLGSWFAYQQYEGVTPDILTSAKGITSSALPASVTVVSKEIAHFMEEYRWWNVATFAGHPLAMAAVAANLEAMIEEKLPEHCAMAGEYLGKKLRDLEQKHRSVGLVAGAGTFWAVEMVRDRKNREPIVAEDRHTLQAGDSSQFPSVVVGKKCYEQKVIAGGWAPNSLRIGPSCNISEEEIDIGISAIDKGLDEVDKMIH